MELNMISAVKRQKRRRIWQKLLGLVACVVVFCTTYALILPAITQETETFCGHEAHEHSEECMKKELVCGFEEGVTAPELSHGEPHSHGDDCYEQTQTLLCELEEVEPHLHSETCTLSEHTLTCTEPECEPHTHEAACSATETIVICGQEECEAHTHATECYTMEVTLSCELEESAGHSHTSECEVSERTLSCELEEGEGHTHSAECESWDALLICQTEETSGHTHSDSCLLSESVLACGQEENEGHSHLSECFLTESILGCGQEEHEGHAHSDACQMIESVLSCGMEEYEGHCHTESCQLTESILTCTEPESEEHSHNEACYTEQTSIVCGVEKSDGHSHGQDCYTEQSTWICGTEESAGHSHGENCYTEQIAIVCNVPESDGHSHSESCYIEQTTVICGSEEFAGHTHSESCYVEQISVNCGMEEQPAHTHNEQCYTPVMTYSCGIAETAPHTHGDSCNSDTISYGCGMEEFEGHTHSEICYTLSFPLVCLLEETSGHSHTEECYAEETINLCGLTETEGHTHSDTCFTDILTYTCGLEETEGHAHDEACYQTEEVLICEETEIPTSEQESSEVVSEEPQHEHTEECYEEKQVCDKEEHEHTLICYSDPTADLESKSYWESTLPATLTGDLQKDIVAIAKSQLGYSESVSNYIVMEDGIHTKGYSRYGAWYGDPYGDWCAMFVSFCLRHAGAEKIPLDANCPNWIESLKESGLYHEAAGYIPEPADIIFFDWDGDRISDHVGLVAEYIPSGEFTPAQVSTIEGNSGDRVQYLTYELSDTDILGYGTVSWLDSAELSVRGDDYSVTVSFGPEANIPANAELRVRELEQGSEEYQLHYDEATKAIEPLEENEEIREIAFARFFDISFVVNNSVIEPDAPVEVSICYDDPVEISTEDNGMAIHFAKDGTELLDVETDAPIEGETPSTESFVFTQDGFSVTGTLVVTRAATTLAAGPDYSGALNLTDYISSIQVMDGSGTSTTAFADGDSFSIVLEGTVYGYLFGDGNDKQLMFTLPEAMELSIFTCSDTATHAAIDAETNSFCMTLPAVYENWNYQSVSFRVELTGQVINQTGSTLEAYIRGQSYKFYASKQTFSATLGDGTAVTANLLGSSFSPEEYELVVESMDGSGYISGVQNYINNNYNRRELDDTAFYTVYLQNKSNPEQKHPLPAPYSLRMEFADSPVSVSSLGQAIVLNMNNGTPGKPTSSSASVSGSGVSAASISDQYSAMSQFVVLSIGGISEGTTGSGYSLSYNDQKDAFISDSAFASYYNFNSPIGTSGSFHIVAFGTANLDTHTNGNVLANNLYANSNFGTNNYDMELSYVQNYVKVNSNSASKNEHILVVGSDNVIGFFDNNNKYTVNGQGLDRPKNLIQDRDTALSPFIDLTRVEAEIRQISANLAGYPDGNLMITMQSQKNIISLTDPHSVGILNVDPSDEAIFGKDYIQLSGFESGNDGSIVINVDCTGYNEIDLPKALIVMDGQEQGTNEVTEFSNGKVLWNFINADGVTINTHLMTGMVIAPGATVNVMQNLNGTVVAENVNIKAESHRTDFTGKIIPKFSDDEHSLTLQKIRSGNAGVTLSNAHFDLYVWDGAAWIKGYTDAIITNSDGLFVLEGLKPDTAYKLVETEAPPGYELMEEPLYFWLSDSGSGTSPVVKPQGFAGMEVASGGFLTVANIPDKTVETTSIELQKSWNTDQEITVPRVYVELYQLVWNEGYLVDRVLMKTVTITRTLGWKYTVADLPKNGTDDSGNQVTFTYAALELPVEGYKPQYSVDMDVGTADGTIIITNSPEGSEEVYELPATGGYGSAPYTFIGIFLMCLTMGYCLMLQIRRRREDDS